MGIKYNILDELRKEENKDGLTIEKLAEKLDTTTNSIRATINRDLKPKKLVIVLKKIGKWKVYGIPKDENGKPRIENNEYIVSLLKENYESNLFLMKFFQENKEDLEDEASEKQEEFENVISTLKKTRDEITKLNGDTSE